MTTSVFRLRISKLEASLMGQSCWRALSFGVVPSIEHLPLLRTLHVDGVIDVRANRGQFTLACCHAVSRIPIVPSEPIPDEAKKFSVIHRHNKNITLVQCALGESRSQATLHLSRSADSSSLLPIGSRQTRIFPNTAKARSITVPVQTLGRFTALLRTEVCFLR